MAYGKIGIALGGGAARGWAHIGVLRALSQAGIVPDIVAGTSIGAVVGGCYAAGRLDELEGFARDLTRRKVFGYLDFNLSGSGLITGQRLVERLDGHLRDVHIEELATRFVAVATEIGTGHEVWLSRGRVVDAMRASYALPGIFKPMSIDGRWLFDGALVNPVPVSVCRALGARYVIAVNLNFGPVRARHGHRGGWRRAGNGRGGRGQGHAQGQERTGGKKAAASVSSSDQATAAPASRPLWWMLSISCRTALRARALPAIRPTR